MTTTERQLLSGLPITSALNGRDRTVRAGDPIARLDEVFRNPSVTVVPVLDEFGRYVGAIGRDSLAASRDARTAREVAQPQLIPVVCASVGAETALAQLDADGGKRLVVVADDGTTYRGLVCLRSDRKRLCVESECHSEVEA